MRALPERDIPEWGAAAGVRLDAWPRARRLLRRIDVRVVAATNRSLVTVRAQMRRHDWPGNVRELRNFVERTVVLRDGHMEIDAAADPSAIDLDRSFRDGKEDVITQYERRYLEALLASTGGMSLCRLMQRHGVKPSGA